MSAVVDEQTEALATFTATCPRCANPGAVWMARRIRRYQPPNAIQTRTEYTITCPTCDREKL
jgi:DNA-directed RNA polymerase subunit M/transcription elongation factor TFIIS